jgi:hypothetical protein
MPFLARVTSECKAEYLVLSIEAKRWPAINSNGGSAQRIWDFLKSRTDEIVHGLPRMFLV